MRFREWCFVGKMAKRKQPEQSSYDMQLLSGIQKRLKGQSTAFIHEHGESILLLLSCLKTPSFYSTLVELYHFLVAFLPVEEPCVVLASKHLGIKYPLQPKVEYDDVDKLLTTKNVVNGKATNVLVAQSLALCSQVENSHCELVLRGRHLVDDLQYRVGILKTQKLSKDSEHLIYFTTHLILLSTVYGTQPSCVDFTDWKPHLQAMFQMVDRYWQCNLDVWLELKFCLLLLGDKKVTLPESLPPLRNTATFIHCALLFLLAKEAMSKK
jgi:hypothetical protein